LIPVQVKPKTSNFGICCFSAKHVALTKGMFPIPDLKVKQLKTIQTCVYLKSLSLHSWVCTRHNIINYPFIYCILIIGMFTHDLSVLARQASFWWNSLLLPFKNTFMVVIAWQLDLQLPVKSLPITTKVVSSKPVHGELYLIPHYVIKFVSDLRQVGGFLRFPTPMKLTATIEKKYCWKWC